MILEVVRIIFSSSNLVSSWLGVTINYDIVVGIPFLTYAILLIDYRETPFVVPSSFSSPFGLACELLF